MECADPRKARTGKTTSPKERPSVYDKKSEQTGGEFQFRASKKEIRGDLMLKKESKGVGTRNDGRM